MDDSQKEARQHQSHRNFGIDPWPSRTGRVAVRDGFAQPRKIQNAVDADEDVVVWKEVSQRAVHVQLELIALFPTQHHGLPQTIDRASESGDADLFNSPRVHWMRNALSCVPKARQSMAAAALRQAFIQPDRTGVDNKGYGSQGAVG
jgi:hypothetical protein